ncbi:MAG: GatB/YqeY domain-containing protein [Negativicutes bacterium]|nr:GatB/YqeY domain-containing protein [Negativicutes bacterium]
MKDREAGKLRLSVLRMVKSAAKYLEIERKEGLTDEDLLTVFVKEVKQRRDSIDEFKKGNRMDLVEASEAELAILQEYLPQQLSEAELRELVQAAVQETGAQSKKDMGKVMADLMPRTKGRADGKLLNRIVQEFLP